MFEIQSSQTKPREWGDFTIFTDWASSNPYSKYQRLHSFCPFVLLFLPLSLLVFWCFSFMLIKFNLISQKLAFCNLVTRYKTVWCYNSFGGTFKWLEDDTLSLIAAGMGEPCKTKWHFLTCLVFRVFFSLSLLLCLYIPFGFRLWISKLFQFGFPSLKIPWTLLPAFWFVKTVKTGALFLFYILYI